MKNDFDKEYGFLWDGTEHGWVLLKAPDLKGGYSIYNKNKRTLLHIESSELNAILCMRMKEAGAEILDDVSLGEVVVKPEGCKNSIDSAGQTGQGQGMKESNTERDSQPPGGIRVSPEWRLVKP